MGDLGRKVFKHVFPSSQNWQGVATAAKKTMEFEQKHHLTERAAQATRSSVEAAREANQKYGVTQKIGQGVSTAVNKTVEFERQHQVSSRAMQAARSSVDAARDANQQYGITRKIGQGASAAYSKAREIEERHHVTSTVASGIKTGASHAVSAASSVGSKIGNPFAAQQQVTWQLKNQNNTRCLERFLVYCFWDWVVRRHRVCQSPSWCHSANAATKEKSS